MPLASNTLPTELTFNVQDYNNEDASTSIFVPAATDLTDLAVNIALFEAAIAGMTDGFITGGGLSRAFNQTDPRPEFGGPATSNVQRKGVFIFENSFGTYSRYQIPSIDRALVRPGTTAIDVTAPAVAAYIALMTTAALAPLPGVRPIGGNGYQLVRLVEAYEDTVSRPNPRRR